MTNVERSDVPSLAETVSGLASDVQHLLRGEVNLARAELEEKATRIGHAGIWLMAGGLLAFSGLIILLQGIATALAISLPPWAAFVIVGGVVVVVGAILARLGAGMMSAASLAPDRTAENLSRDAQLVKEHTR
jgi:uncharacterized membrane protein YqjE